MMGFYDWFWTRPMEEDIPKRQTDLTIPDEVPPVRPPDAIRDGRAAEKLLADPLLKKCFVDVRSNYLRRLDDLDRHDHLRLQQIKMELAALKDVQQVLTTYAANGQIAQKRVDPDQRVDRAPMRPTRSIFDREPKARRRT